MSRLQIDEITKSQAMEYADNEAEICGFKRGGHEWQEAVSRYVKFAISTMSVGRNPRGFRYKVYTTLYSNVFSQKGWAGEVAQNYESQTGRGLPVKEVDNRILASLTNISKLFENGILGLKTTTRGNKQGEIDPNDASDFQFPDKALLGKNKEEYELQISRVLRAWIIRDLSITILLECLKPFFKLTVEDVEYLSDRINLQKITMDDVRRGQREVFIQRLQEALAPTFDKIDIMKILK